MTSGPAAAPAAPATARRAPLLLLGTAAVVLLALRAADAVVGLPASGALYRHVVEGVAQAPGWLGTAAEVVGEAGIVLLGLVFCLALWRAGVRGGAPLGRAVLAGGAVVVAYASSEVAKLVLTQPRPCAASALATVAECPGDWSLPSNHATIAGALAVAVLLTVPRWGLVTVPVALAVAVTRVAVGVHYPHDVLTGVVWGAVVVAVAVLVLGGPAGRLGERGVRRWAERARSRREP